MLVGWTFAGLRTIICSLLSTDELGMSGGALTEYLYLGQMVDYLGEAGKSPIAPYRKVGKRGKEQKRKRKKEKIVTLES